MTAPIYRRKYVEVYAVFEPDGRIKPLSLTWDDGESYEVDRILDVRQAASLRAGGNGLRYTCLFGGKQRYLFLQDDNRWFVELKES